MNAREIFELSFGICVIVIAIVSFIAIVKDIIRDNDNYTDCEV